MNSPQYPHSEEMERSVLSILLNHADQFEDSVRRLPLEAFYIPANKVICHTIMELVQHRKPVNHRTLIAALTEQGALEDCGGANEITSLVDYEPGTVGMEHYITIVRNKWMLRKSMNSFKEMYAKCAAPGSHWPDVKLELEQELLDISREGEQEDKSLKDITLDWLDGLESRFDKNNTNGFWTGIDGVDEILGPSLPGELVIIASQTSGGKTALAMQAALASVSKGLPVAVFSLEMMNEQLWDRMFSHLAKIQMGKWRRPLFTNDERDRIHDLVPKFVNLPLYINQNRRINLASLSSKARRLKASKNIGAIVVDYVQRVRGSEKTKANRYLEVAEISDECKQLALELGIVVIAPCQINKNGDPRESADIEMDADRLFVIKEGELWIQKDRQNKRFYGIPLQFNGEYVTFEDGPPPMENNGGRARNRARPVNYDRD